MYASRACVFVPRPERGTFFVCNGAGRRRGVHFSFVKVGQRHIVACLAYSLLVMEHVYYYYYYCTVKVVSQWDSVYQK
jgi:hypothetical protein